MICYLQVVSALVMHFLNFHSALHLSLPSIFLWFYFSLSLHLQMGCYAIFSLCAHLDWLFVLGISPVIIVNVRLWCSVDHDLYYIWYLILGLVSILFGKRQDHPLRSRTPPPVPLTARWIWTLKETLMVYPQSAVQGTLLALIIHSPSLIEFYLIFPPI